MFVLIVPSYLKINRYIKILIAHGCGFLEMVIPILQNPEHTYTSCGTFNVSLTVTDNRGCQSTFDTTGSILPTNYKCFKTDSTNLCANDSILFSMDYSMGDTAISTWLLDFGDGLLKQLWK